MMRAASLLAVAVAIVGCAKAGPVGQIDNDLTDAGPGGDGGEPDGPPPIDAAQVTTLQQTVDNTIAAANSVACINSARGETRDQSWFRVFALAEHNVMNRPFYVQHVTFAIQQSRGAPPAQLKIGTYSGALGTETLSTAMIAPLNSATVTIPETQTGAMVMVPIAATIPANANLVVELHTPDLFNTGGKNVLIGASTGPETAGRTGYWQSPVCSRPAPIAVGPTGFPSAHLIITVTGQY